MFWYSFCRNLLTSEWIPGSIWNFLILGSSASTGLLLTWKVAEKGDSKSAGLRLERAVLEQGEKAVGFSFPGRQYHQNDDPSGGCITAGYRFLHKTCQLQRQILAPPGLVQFPSASALHRSNISVFSDHPGAGPTSPRRGNGIF